MSSEYLTNRLIDTINNDKMSIGIESEELYKEELKLEEQERLLLLEEDRIQNEEMLYSEELKEFNNKVRREWFNPGDDVSSKRLKLNIGGEKFELSASEVLKDKFSLFTVLLSQNNLIYPEKNEYYFFDRDWFLFRFIKSFLEYGSLPDKVSTLNSLYSEAEFYHLENLKNSIGVKLEKMGRLAPGKSISTLHHNLYNNSYNNSYNYNYSTSSYPYKYNSNPTQLYNQINKKDPLPDPFGFTKRK